MAASGSPPSLKPTLDAHAFWILSRGQIGERADLRDRDLRSYDLTDVNLMQADLTNVDFRGVAARCINLKGAELGGAQLQDADLQDADLAGATNVLSHQLARANLCRSKLPEGLFSDDYTASIEDASKNSRTLSFTMLLACTYCWLTIGTTTDARLLTNSGTTPLPIIETTIPIVGFYWIAPVILLTIYVYYQFYLQRLWERVSLLPAVFPDGATADQHIHPWLLNQFVFAYFTQLRQRRPLLVGPQILLSNVLTWWIVPFTLLLFWFRYLRRHDWAATSYHLLLLMISIGIALLCHRVAAVTLRSGAQNLRAGSDIPKHAIKYIVSATGFLAIVVLISYGIIAGIPRESSPDSHFFDPRIGVPAMLRTIGSPPFANLVDADVSIRRDGWSDDSYDLVTAGRLAESDLQGANASGAFFIGSDLRESHLQYADLSEADLRTANLYKACLQAANLTRADMRNSNISGANLKDAMLVGAKLADARLVGIETNAATNFKSAHLERVHFDGATLSNVQFDGANLQSAYFPASTLENTQFFDADIAKADFRGAIGLEVDQIKQARNWEKAFFDDEFFMALGLPPREEDPPAPSSVGPFRLELRFLLSN